MLDIPFGIPKSELCPPNGYEKSLFAIEDDDDPPSPTSPAAEAKAEETYRIAASLNTIAEKAKAALERIIQHRAAAAQENEKKKLVAEQAARSLLQVQEADQQLEHQRMSTTTA